MLDVMDDTLPLDPRQRLIEAMGSLPTGAVVILDEFNRLPAEEMLLACRLAKEQELRMSISMNPGYRQLRCAGRGCSTMSLSGRVPADD